MTPSVLPFAPGEHTSDSRGVRESRSVRESTRKERVDRRNDREDFAGELAAAREAVRGAPESRPAERPHAGAEVENSGEISESGSNREANAPASSSPSRDASRLDPELRAAIERVTARMRSEHGHDVTIVEGVRTTERQAQLFAQGRSAPGSVVTWTMNSKHLHGHAADLMVDGGWTDTEAYARLQKVASEEGLSVLGMRDPGHVELLSTGSIRFTEAVSPDAQQPELTRSLAQPAGNAAAPRMSFVNAESGLASQARVAEVALVARVAEPVAAAQPATVAQVASVPTPGAVAVQAFQRGSGGRHGSSGQQDNPQRDGANVLVEQATAEGSHMLAPGQDARLNPRVMELRSPEVTSSGADPLSRIAEVDHVRQAAGPRAPTALTLRLDNGMGGEDRIRLDLRGSSVGATMNVGDARLAERIGSTMHELRQALERRGLAPERLQVRVAGAESVEAARVNAVQLEREAGRFSSAQHTPQRETGEQPQWQQRDAHAQRDPHDTNGRRQRHDTSREVPAFTTEER